MAVIRCTEHMCPIRVHWHVKTNYWEYWSVKATITNYDIVTNYSDWNLMVRYCNTMEVVIDVEGVNMKICLPSPNKSE
jgi:hypothetical protein